jgi:26S proteasome regulatory subunit T5
MATLEDLDDLEQQIKKDVEDADDQKGKDGDAEMKDAVDEDRDPLFDEIEQLSTQDIITRRRLIENDSRIMRSEFQRLTHEKDTMNGKIKDNLDKIEDNKCVVLIGRVRLC